MGERVLAISILVVALSLLFVSVMAKGRISQLETQLRRSDWHCEQRGVIGDQDDRHTVDPEHTHLVCIYGWEDNPNVRPAS